ncbi:MAG: YbaK/EbsC family protein [Bacteroidia bacterium]
MKVSQLIGSTLRQVEGHTPGMTFLLRAGYIRKPLADTTILLTLGQKVVDKIAAGFAKILNLAGATQIQLPVLPPEDFWSKSGISDVLPQDVMALFTHYITGEITSYRQLPKIAWQIRPASTSGSGSMLDVWAVAASQAELSEIMSKLHLQFAEILNNWMIPYIGIHAQPGISGGKAVGILSPYNFGKTRYLIESSDYYPAENTVMPVSKPVPPAEVFLPAEKVYTPATASIQELADFLKIPGSKTAKVVFFTGKVIRKKQPQLIIAVIRGDREVNEMAVRNHTGAVSLRPATEAEIAAVGCVPGFASPVGIRRENVIVIADDEIPQTANLVAGANEKDYHIQNVCYGRDYTADIVADIVLASAGLPGPNGTPLEERWGIELGKKIVPGTWYSDVLHSSFMSEQGKPEPFQLGYFQWDLEMILAVLSEIYRDENGLEWPDELAPFDITLISLEDSDETTEEAAKLYEKLQAAGKSVLFDDRHKKVAGPGVKFTDADLQGFPLRITVSKRALEEGGVEVKKRGAAEKKIVKIEELLTPPPANA